MSSIKVVEDNHLPKVVIENCWFGTSAEIYIHGAHLTSFKIDGEELIYVSKDASFSPTSKIRGGIPICFPQFADRGKLELMHGFARSSNEFVLVKKEVDTLKKEVSCTFRLKDSDSTRKFWDHSFLFDIKYTLFGKSLLSEVTVTNNGEEDFEFTMALHTYYNVKDINKARLLGLQGVKYFDKMRESKVFEEASESLVIEKEVDRIYTNVPKTVEIEEEGVEDVIVIDKDQGFGDAVVWNPWVEKSKRMGDLPNDDFNKFLCVEIGVVGEPTILKSGNTFAGRMLIERRKK